MSKHLGMWVGAVILLRATLAYFMPLMDPSEGRYAQIAADMVGRHEYMTPMVWMEGQFVPFMGKPPLYFWLASLGLGIFGHSEFAVRGPSLLAALLLVGFLYAALRRTLDERVARAASIVTVSSVFFFALAGGALLDMVLTLCVTAAVFSYFGFLVEPDRTARRRWSLVVFAALALGFLTKGPVALALFGLPVFLWTAFTRSWRELREHAWGWGTALFLLIASPWFVAQELRTPGFLQYFFIHENLMRYTSEQYGDLYGSGHHQVFGISLLLMALAALPWTAWAGCVAWKRRRIRDGVPTRLSLGARYFLLVTVTTAAFFVFAKQLLWYYVLPAVPACAAWCAIVLCRAEVSERRILATASAAVAAWCLLLASSFPWQDAHKSSRSAMTLSRAIYTRAGLDGEIHFYRQTPYSALFYGAPLVHPGLPTTMAAELATELADPDRDLFLIKDKYVRDISAADLRQMTREGHQGEWTVFAEKQHVP